MRGAGAGVLALLTLVGVQNPAAAEQATDARPVPTITVQGEASEAFLPDKAILSLGVVTERPKAVDASADNSKAVRIVIDAVKAEGIEARAIQSTSVSLEPVFKDDSETTRRIVGFRAGNQLEVDVTPPDRAGLLAGTLIDKGVNSIDGIGFVSSANAERADRLRGEAMHDARHRAEIYVAALGLKLGRVLAITPAGSTPPSRRLAMKMESPRRQSAPVAVPLEAGEQTETESVSVTWEISER